MMAGADFDLIVLGAGAGGLRAALLAADSGRRVAVIESGRVGGARVARGGLPKALLAIGAGFAEDFAAAEAFGWQAGAAGFDWARLMAAKNAEITRQETAATLALREAGVTLIEGRGRLSGPRAVVVGERVLTAPVLLIATGSRPALPDLPGCDHAVTTTEALDLMQLPRRAVVLGGGPHATEFACIFNALGVEVTQVMRAQAPLPGFDPDLRAGLAAAMEARGVRLVRGHQPLAIERDGALNRVLLAGPGGDKAAPVEAELVLAATGRVPDTAGLGLETTGVALGPRGGIAVDAYSRSSVESIWAVGDVTDRLRLTPAALAEAEAFVHTAFDGCPTAVEHHLVPIALATTPALACVGLGEDEARRLYGGGVETHLARPRTLRERLTGRESGALVKLVVDRDEDRVLGVHVLGPGAAEIIGGFAVALQCGATKAQFDATLGVHPTLAEALLTLPPAVPGAASGSGPDLPPVAAPPGAAPDGETAAPPPAVAEPIAAERS
ncbi:FAD-dependent oxidoreductase [Phaeospirillum tilakii]|uniref:FAD-dependent oxidoreductase n=1 Tax=Phaeospirillum tilakii TaxID=741673 RepID=A0ABW5CI79_9PROT